MTSSPYDPVLRNLIVAHKERQALALRGFLAERLAVSVHALLTVHPEGPDPGRPARPVVLVPVPSSAVAVRSRGYDATWTLARLAARRLRPRPLGAARLLEQRRGVLDSAGLGASQRAANVGHGFRLRRPGRGLWVVLVDDVVTTGASLTEAARVLREAGVPVLGAATVAATVRRRPASVPPPRRG